MSIFLRQIHDQQEMEVAELIDDLISALGRFRKFSLHENVKYQIPTTNLQSTVFIRNKL
jgi:hypothetical protein